MTELRNRLERLGLSQYLDGLVAEGFDSWEIVLDITESDLHALGVKLGHRRKLQRAIAQARGLPNDAAVPTLRKEGSSFEDAYQSDVSITESKTSKRSEAGTPRAAPTKRKYRRHPKPDENAPERPASAYVVFSNQMRDILKGQDLSFTDIAKIVGERWQVLSPDSRGAFEREAAAAKEKYYAELAEYKKTSQYAQYQEYLAEFKAKQAAQTEGKRTKIDAETSASGRSSSHEGDKAKRRISSGATEGQPLGHRRSGSSPPSAHSQLHGRRVSTQSTSPGTYGLSTLGTSLPRERQSPLSASPLPSGHFHDASYDSQNASAASSAEVFDRRVDPRTARTQLQHRRPYSPASRPSLASFGSNSVDSAGSRESIGRPPSLVHEDTNMSNTSGHTQTSPPYPTTFLPPLDSSKMPVNRVLPQPVTNPNATPSPLDPRPPVLPPISSQSPDLRQGGWSALLLATERARDNDAKSSHQEKPP